MHSRLNTRVKQHLSIVTIAIASLAILHAIVPGDNQKYLWSMATAYTSLALFGVTLSIGPLNVLMKKNNPISSDLRRDFGIWCGIVGIVHVIIGIQVHMGNFLLYFFNAVDGPNAFGLRSDLFGAANYVGLIATLVLFLLLLVSNDFSLKILKPARWKRIQQWSYALFFLVMAHGILFQVIEKRAITFVVFLSALLIVPTVIQSIGVRKALKIKK